MNGKQHKLTGVALATGVAACVLMKEQSYATQGMLMAMSIPFGAMLPDIDHNNSKLGSQRKAAVDTASFIGKVVGSIFYVYYVGSTFMKNHNKAYIILAITAVLFVSLWLLSKVGPINELLHFATKHRGLMHTLIPPIGIWLLMKYTNPVQAIMLITKGLFLGYIVHLIGDLMTVSGCPLLWPIIKKPIRILRIDSSSTSGEKLLWFVCILMCAGMFFATYRNGELIKWFIHL